MNRRTCSGVLAVPDTGPIGGTMRRVFAILGVIAALLSMGTLAAAAPSGDLLPNEQHYLDDNSSGNNGTKSGSALNMAVVGQTSLGDRGFNGDVFIHKGYAYVGRWGFFDSSHPQFCPAGGVAVIDATNPAGPHQVANLEVLGASHEDVAVYTARYGPLAGHDIAAVGLQYCAGARTDLAHPSLVSTFGIKKDLGLNPALGQGCFALSFGHGMDPSEDGRTLFVSYWDAGFIDLDISNPYRPHFVGRFTYPADADGDGHSTSYDDTRKLLFAADEDFCKTGPGTVTGWGYLRVIDESNPRAPVQIGQFHTPNSYGLADPGAGDYVIHNPLVVGTDVYLSWYSDGIRVVDASDPRNPREVAYFVPPAGKDPIKPSQRNTLTNTTQVWGVAVDTATGLVYASDMNTGLWIIKRTDR